jgi:hypothetical protein
MKERRLSARGEMRKFFWEAYLDCFPEEGVHGPATATIARWQTLPGTDLVISLYVALDAVGAFIRGPRAAPPELVYEQLLPFAEQLASALGVPLGAPDAGYHFHVKRRADTLDFDSWSDSIQWLNDTVKVYEGAVQVDG